MPTEPTIAELERDNPSFAHDLELLFDDVPFNGDYLDEEMDDLMAFYMDDE